MSAVAVAVAVALRDASIEEVAPPVESEEVTLPEASLPPPCILDAETAPLDVGVFG